MNIIYWLRKLFNKEENNQISYYGKDLIIPSRNNYQNNPNMIKKIDNYKKDFISLLNSKKINLSSELNIDNLEDNMIMHTNLLLHLIMKDENDIELINDNKDEQDKVFDNLIKIEKLNLYFQKCLELYSNLIAEINALMEIYNEHIVKYHRSEKAIKERIDKLKMSFACYYFQLNGINIELNACINKTVINELDDETINEKVKNRYNYLYFLIRNSKLDIKFDYPSKEVIAKLEYELEKWAYKNTNELDNIYESINKLKADFIPSKFENILHTADILLAKLAIFDEFCRNKIDENEFYKLCRLKFEIITYFINDKEEFDLFIKQYPNYDYHEIFKRRNTKEYICYKKIIMDMIAELNKKLSIDVCFDYEKPFAIRNIKNYLKTKDKIFVPENILYNELKLKLLCIFNHADAKEKLITYFDSNSIKDAEVINETFIKNIYFQNRYKLIRKIPLSSMFDYLGTSYWDDYANTKYLCELYRLTMKRTHHHGIYCLPKGYNIIRDRIICALNEDNFDENINRSFSRNREFDYEKITWKKVQDNTLNKKLILPNDIRWWDRVIYFRPEHEFYEVILNEGIEAIRPEVIPKSVKKINIPSSLEHFYSTDKSEWSHLETIKFDDWENSKIINDYVNLRDLLYLIIKDKYDIDEPDEQVIFVYKFSSYKDFFDFDPEILIIGGLTLNIPDLKINPNMVKPLHHKYLTPELYSELRNDYLDKLTELIQKQIRKYKDKIEEKKLSRTLKK